MKSSLQKQLLMLFARYSCFREYHTLSLTLMELSHWLQKWPWSQCIPLRPFWLLLSASFLTYNYLPTSRQEWCSCLQNHICGVTKISIFYRSCFLPPKSYNSLVAAVLSFPTFPFTRTDRFFLFLFYFLPSSAKQISASVQAKLIYVNNMDGDSLVIIRPTFWGEKRKVSLIPGSLITDLIHNWVHLICQRTLIYLSLLI